MQATVWHTCSTSTSVSKKYTAQKSVSKSLLGTLFFYTFVAFNRLKMRSIENMYLSPEIEVIQVSVQAGFGLSDMGYAGWEDGPATGGNSNDLGDF